MKVEHLSTHEVEQARQTLVRELVADSGAEWASEYQPGSAGYHELLDRAALVSDMLERHIVAHPACVARPEWYALAEQAAAALRQLYQQVGAEHLAVESSHAGSPNGVPR